MYICCITVGYATLDIRYHRSKKKKEFSRRVTRQLGWASADDILKWMPVKRRAFYSALDAPHGVKTQVERIKSIFFFSFSFSRRKSGVGNGCLGWRESDDF